MTRFVLPKATAEFKADRYNYPQALLVENKAPFPLSLSAGRIPAEKAASITFKNADALIGFVNDLRQVSQLNDIADLAVIDDGLPLKANAAAEVKPVTPPPTNPTKDEGAK